MLTTEQVSINTMQVEIKSIMVGKKQLTLSLMRQIIEEPLIDEDNLLFRGVPWGHVNYFWGDNKDRSYPSSINVIWQKGDVLRRSIVSMNKKYDIYSENMYRKEINKLADQINYYGSNNGIQVIRLKEELSIQEDYLQELLHMKEVYIPKYLQLVTPLKKLDHFYIAV